MFDVLVGIWQVAVHSLCLIYADSMIESVLATEVRPELFQPPTCDLMSFCDVVSVKATDPLAKEPQT